MAKKTKHKKDAKFIRLPNDRTGRPTRLTKKVYKTVQHWLRKGHYFETALALADIPKQTGFEWMRRGHKDRAAGTKTRCSMFLNMVEKAQAEAEAAGLNMIEVHARRNWQAMAWRLERRNPKQWGLRQRVEVEGGETPIRQEIQIKYVDDWRSAGGEEDDAE